ncbi:MAG: universal stress protein [Deltaproteobacteria bacterium]|nr:universal stress protein [Deltaproteobacteria bacterium]
MFKNILVCCDGSEEADRNLQLAVSLAGLGGGRVRGLFVKRFVGPEIATWSPGLEMGAETPSLLDPALIAEIEAEQEERGRQVAASFSRLVGGNASGLEVVRGDLMEELVKASRSADLVVMGRGVRQPEAKTWRLSETTRRVLKKSWAPVLLPPVAASWRPGGPYLLAYDGSLAANCGLRQVAQLAALTGGALTILSVGDAEVTAANLKEAQSYLHPYGLNLSLEGRTGKPEAAILELSREQNFGLVVLGAHGHHRIKDILLGTTTEKILHELDLAFLICSR